MELNGPLALYVLGMLCLAIGHYIEHYGDANTAPPKPPSTKERGPRRKLSATVLSLLTAVILWILLVAPPQNVGAEDIAVGQSIGIVPTVFADINLGTGVPQFSIGLQVIMDSPIAMQRRITLLIPKRPGVDEDITSYLKGLSVVRSSIIQANKQKLDKRHTMNFDLAPISGLPLSCRGIGIEFRTTAPGRAIVNVQFDQEHLTKLEKVGIAILYLLFESEIQAGDDQAHSITVRPIALKSISKLIPAMPEPEPVPAEPRPTPKPLEEPKPRRLLPGVPVA